MLGPLFPVPLSRLIFDYLDTNGDTTKRDSYRFGSPAPLTNFMKALQASETFKRFAIEMRDKGLDRFGRNATRLTEIFKLFKLQVFEGARETPRRQVYIPIAVLLTRPPWPVEEQSD